MAYTTDTNTEIVEFLSRAQSWLGAFSTTLAAKVSKKKPLDTYIDDLRNSYMLDSFIKALDNQYNTWTEAEILEFIQYWDAKLWLKKYPYIQRSAFNLRITFS